MGQLSSLSVAGKFIQNSFSENIGLTNMQIQKMVYIANGLYLALTNKPLIYDNVEAWSYGPVISNLYNKLKEFGSGYITVDKLTSYSDPVPKDDDINKVIEFTWEACKKADGIKLSNWTHAPDSPWTKAVNNRQHIIPNEYMAEYFKKFIKKPQNA